MLRHVNDKKNNTIYKTEYDVSYNNSLKLLRNIKWTKRKKQKLWISKSRYSFNDEEKHVKNKKRDNTFNNYKTCGTKWTRFYPQI